MNTAQTPTAVPTPDDEISLVELALTLWKGKWWIAGFTLLGAIIGLTVALLSPNIYESKIVYMVKSEQPTVSLGGAAALLGMAGGGTSASLSKYKPVLESTDLLIDVIEKHQLLKPLFPELVDTTTGEWRDDLEEMPSVLDGAKNLRSILGINFGKKDEETLTLSLQHTNPQLACLWVQWFAETFLERIEVMEVTDSEQGLAFYRAKLKEAESPDARTALAELLAEETKKSLLLGRSKFQVIDQARVPERKVKPKRAVIGIVTMMAGFIIGVVFVFSLGFTRDLLKKTSEINSTSTLNN